MKIITNKKKKEILKCTTLGDFDLLIVKQVILIDNR